MAGLLGAQVASLPLSPWRGSCWITGQVTRWLGFALDAAERSCTQVVRLLQGPYMGLRSEVCLQENELVYILLGLLVYQDCIKFQLGHRADSGSTVGLLTVALTLGAPKGMLSGLLPERVWSQITIPFQDLWWDQRQQACLQGY